MEIEQRANTKDPLFDVNAAGAYLGGISPTTIYTWLSLGKLPRTKVGSRVMVRQSALDAIIRDE